MELNWLNLQELDEDFPEFQFPPVPTGPHTPALHALIRLVITAPSTEPQQQQEAVRILQDNPPLMDFFIRNRQKERGLSTEDYLHPDTDRTWQQSVTAEERRHLVELIAYTIKAYPYPGRPTDFWSGEPVLMETSVFGTAGSRQDYYRMLAEELRRVVTQLEEKKLRRDGEFFLGPLL